MHLYIPPHTDVFSDPKEHAADEEYEEGHEFSLMAVDALGMNTYKIIDGIPTLISVAQVIGISQEQP